METGYYSCLIYVESQEVIFIYCKDWCVL